MNRLTKEVRNTIILLANRGDSLRQISKTLRLAKSTIYYHTRKRFGRRYVQMAFDYSPTMELGEFLGIFATDGCFYVDLKRYHYTLSISLSKDQRQYAKILQGMVERIVGKRPRIDVKKRMVQLVMRGKAVLGFISHFLVWQGRKAHSVHFRQAVLRLGKDFLRGVLRGLVAGDGGIYAPKHRLSFGVVSKKLVQQFVTLLKEFDIPSHVYSVSYEGKKTLHHVHVTGKLNIQKFKIRVGLTDPTKRRELNIALRR